MTKASFEGWGGIIVKLPGGGGITGDEVGVITGEDVGI